MTRHPPRDPDAARRKAEHRLRVRKEQIQLRTAVSEAMLIETLRARRLLGNNEVPSRRVLNDLAGVLFEELMARDRKSQRGVAGNPGAVYGERELI